MAMVLDGFVSYIQNMLTEIAREEVRMMFGVSDEIAKVGVILGDLKNVLADAERRRIMDISVQGWVRELRGAMYDATDILDLYLLEVMEQRESQLPGCIQPLLLCVQNPNFTHLLGGSVHEALKSLLFSLRDPLFVYNIGSRIKKLNQRLDGIKERSTAFSFINHTPSPSEDQRTAHPDADSGKTGPVLGRSGVVGEKIEEDTRALVEKLTSKIGSVKNVVVVAIVGVGGIGKTTLATKVFNAKTIEHEFKIKIWLSVTQVFSQAKLLSIAITAAEGGIPGAWAGIQEKSLLEPALVDIIRDKKFFLVLDDMWDKEVWDGLLEKPFSHGAPGSRVLVTTRDERIARDMRALKPYHHVDKLGLEDAWSLLKEQVVSSETDEANIDDVKDIGMKIASKCDGLPLAIKVMGGLLREKREINQNDWEEVLKDAAWSVSRMPKELNHAIYISYKNMSSCMKQCFLHFSLIPKDKLLDDDIIIGMWISEGFLHEEQLILARGTMELEKVGRECYMKLIELNLIQPDDLYIDQHHCTMHDVVRSFGQYMCRDEALVAHTGETGAISKLNSQKFLRLSIENQGSELGELEWSMLEAQKSLRTLILIGQLKIKPGDSLIAFSSLWTLHLESANVTALVDSLNQLKHLRYLSIRCSELSGLPENIGKLKFLQLINLGGCASLKELPGSIVKLGQLRYLNLLGTSTEDGIPRGFSGLTNMRKLYGFSTHVDSDWCSLEELGPLSQLRALGLHGLENVSTTSSVTNARLGEKEHLTNLSLNCSCTPGDDGLVSEEKQRRIEEVFDEIFPPPSLDYLDIHGYYGRRLPRWMMSTPAAHLKSLRTLIMLNLACCTQLPDGLCQLPNLKSVQINHAPAIKRVGPEFLQSQAAVAFPRLVKMLLVGMVEWEEWEWEEQVRAFPVLDVLVLRRCKLRCVPRGLASHATNLRQLCIQYVQHLNSLENLASVDYLEVYGNPDLERIANLPNLHKLIIINCPKMKELEGVPALQRLILEGVPALQKLYGL